MTLDSLKSSNSLNKLLDAAKGESDTQEKKSYVDERLWKPELDKSGNGYAVIRFLPAVKGEDLPWAKVWSHAKRQNSRRILAFPPKKAVVARAVLAPPTL